MKFFYALTANKPLNTNLHCSLHSCGCRYSSFIWASEKLKLIYFEMPKAACTSVLAAFGVDYSDPLLLTMPYMIHNQRYCAEPQNNSHALLNMNENFYGYWATHSEFKNACHAAAVKLSEGELWSNPMGDFGFRHFYGSAEQVLDMHPDYKKIIILRNPIDRLASAWNMFYNPGSESWRLQERVTQCKAAAEEKKSLRCFVENIQAYPNHHFNSIARFLPTQTILERGIEIVRFEHLSAYWKDLQAQYHLPALRKHNAAKSYLPSDINLAELANTEVLQEYYAEDLKLMQMTAPG